MRTRILTLAAVFAVVFAAPSMASADITLTAPAYTTDGSVGLSWDEQPTLQSGYTVLRADGDCSGSPSFVEITDVTSAPPTSYPDSLPTPGTYCYEVQGDDAPLSTSNFVTVVYDATPPSGSVSAPASNATLSTLSGPVTVTAAPTDDSSGVASVQFRATPHGFINWADIGTPQTSSPWSIAWTPAADGTYDIEAVITDKAGNVFTTSLTDAVNVLVDGTPPTGSITEPGDGTTISGTTNTLSANISDATSGVASVRFERSNDGGGTWTTIATSASGSSPYTANWNTKSPSVTGTWLVRAFATDQVGNTFPTAAVSVTVDNTGPTTAVTTPAPGALLHGVVSLSATATDSSGVSTVVFEESSNSGGTWTQILPTVTGASPYNSTWDTTGLNGSYLVHAIATDSLGNQTQTPPVSVTLDNANPTGALTSPAPGASVNGSATAVATATDGGSGVFSVQFQSSAPGSGGPWTTFATDSSAPYNAAMSTLADGVYDLRVHVTDVAGNTTDSTTVANVRVDKTAPTGALSAPANLADLSGATNVLSATASDGGSGIQSVAFESSSDNGATWSPIATSTDTSSPYTANWNTTGVNAALEVEAVITDKAGNTFPTPAVNVTVDNHAPSVPGTPTGLTPVSASPTITFTGSTDTGGTAASGVREYVVYRDGNPVSVAGIIPDTGAASYTWSDVANQSTSPVTVAGTYQYKVLAIDKAGNSSTLSPALTVVVDPTGSSAPTGLTASSPSNQHPVISWTAPVSTPFALDHYDVFRNGSLTPYASVSSGTTAFTDTGATDGTYTYQVVAAAFTDSTRGVASGSVTVVYDTTPPSAPTGVAATAAADGSINISWSPSSDAGSGVARYVVRRALSSTAPATIADGDATCSGTATSCSDTTALNGKLYTYSVFAVDGVGNVSLAGVSAGVTAQDQTPPSVPKGLTATPGDGSVTLNWTAASASDDVAGYVLVAKQGSSAPTNETDGIRECSSLVASSTTCTATGLTNGVTYTFGLFALDEALNRSQPAVVSAAPNGKVTDSKGPAAVTKLHATVAGGKVTLTWKNPSDHDFDHVVITSATRKPDSAKASKRVYSGKGTKATIKLTPGSSRWFVVVAYDVVGNASSPASVHVAMPALSPFGPTPKAKVHGPVHLSWPTVKGAKYYNVQVYAGKKRISVSWPAGHSLTLPHAKLKKGTKYTWYVWPGLGAKANAHYGKLIGKNVFTFTG